MKAILSGLFLVLVTNLFAANYNGDIMQFKQPDGSIVDVKLFGSEFYMRSEGLDNYTLVRDEQTKWICYAKLSEDNTKLISTGIVYRGTLNDPASLRNNLNLPHHLQTDLNSRHKLIEENQLKLNGESHKNNRLSTPGQSGNSLAGTPINPVSGNILGLCIVVDFSDEPGTLPMSEFDDFCNDLNYSNFGNNGSVRTFYRDISGGLLDYQNVVYGYFRAPQTFAYYDALPYAQGAKQILSLALTWIKNTGFDFSTLSINPDNSIMAINLMYTGNPPNWAQGMWFHKGSYTGFSANGVHSDVYNCSPANSPLKLSTIAHENGHMICKWPDTYKYDQSEDGIGAFDLMCATGNPFNPVIPNPLFRSNVSWGEVIDVTSYNGLNYDTANSMISYRYTNVNDTNEFFLFEHRQKTGRSMSIPDEGLTIWHVDRNGDNQTLQHEVYLEHANNDISNDYSACYKNPYAPEFSEFSSPNSDWYSGNQSGLLIWGIDSPVVDVMPYHIGPGAAAPNLTLQYLSLSNDNNGNGYLEPGESAELTVEGGNNGQLTSSNAILNCIATGPNAGYITISNQSQNMGSIGLMQPYPAIVNISLDPLTPLGTMIDFEFTLAETNDTATLFVTIIVGRQVLMNNSNSTVCSAVFFDPGLLNNYSTNNFLKKTIYPSGTGNTVQADFTQFQLQYDSLCNYDFLKIYNGPDSLSPLIGTYCGSNSPGIVQSTDATGALTFVFYSDSTTTANGWMAIVSCSSTLGVDEGSYNNINIFPNPTSGKILIESNSVRVLSITDAIGQEINAFPVSEGNNISVDLSNEQSGVYFLKYKSGENIYCKKILLK